MVNVYFPRSWSASREMFQTLIYLNTVQHVNNAWCVLHALSPCPPHVRGRGSRQHFCALPFVTAPAHTNGTASMGSLPFLRLRPSASGAHCLCTTQSWCPLPSCSVCGHTPGDGPLSGCVHWQGKNAKGRMRRQAAHPRVPNSCTEPCTAACAPPRMHLPVRADSRWFSCEWRPVGAHECKHIPAHEMWNMRAGWCKVGQGRTDTVPVT
jgi:hypothetical protein